MGGGGGGQLMTKEDAIKLKREVVEEIVAVLKGEDDA